MKPLTLEQWNIQVSRHLDMISSGAKLVARHACLLTRRPAFESLAEDDLRRCERELCSALLLIRNSQEKYRSLEEE
jgi:hypothetical protein